MKNLTLFFFLTLLSLQSLAEISHEEFQKLVGFFHQEYDSELAAKNQRFYVNQSPDALTEDPFYWSLDIVRASYSSFTVASGVKNHIIYFFGGYGRLKYMSLDGVTMALCHELGHGIAAGPQKESDTMDTASVEGEADYFASHDCNQRIFKYYSIEPSPMRNPIAIKICTQTFTNQSDFEACLRSFQELEDVEIKYFADTEINQENAQTVFFDKPDTSVVSQINTSADFYPTPQCRFDTMIQGTLKKQRPMCWWTP